MNLARILIGVIMGALVTIIAVTILVAAPLLLRQIL